MKSNKLYKYINLLFRIIIGIVAVYFIYTRVNDTFLVNLKRIETSEIKYTFVFLALVLLLLNWGIEAVKWRYTIRKTEKVSVLKAFKLTITGITIGLLTPNRIGEIPARALLLNKTFFKDISLKTVVSSFSQFLITLFIGVIGLMLTTQKFSLIINPALLLFVLIIGVIVFFIIYFKTNKLEIILSEIRFLRDKEIFKSLSEFSMIELFNILLMSFLRYLVFSLQYYLVLKAFNVSLIGMSEMFLIPVCFMIASFIPTIVISEIGVRGSIALFVFGTVSDMDIQIILASILLWLINVALPALFGLLNLKGLKILKEN